MLALAFGVLIVMLLIVGSLWIMSNTNANMLPTNQPMGAESRQMERMIQQQ